MGSAKLCTLHLRCSTVVCSTLFHADQIWLANSFDLLQ